MTPRHKFTTEAEWLEYLRYYYAGLAMQGLSAHPELGHRSNESVAELSTKQATALIEALKKEQ